MNCVSIPIVSVVSILVVSVLSILDKDPYLKNLCGKNQQSFTMIADNSMMSYNKALEGLSIEIEEFNALYLSLIHI